MQKNKVFLQKIPSESSILPVGVNNDFGEKVILYLNPISKFDLLCAIGGSGILFPKLFRPTVRKKCSRD